jgi:hypothetical protein
MKTLNIGNIRDLQVSAEPTKRTGSSEPRSITHKSHEAGLSDVVPAHGGRLASDRLDAIHSRLNNIAQSIRFVDRTAERIETFIDEMKARLKTIRKQYPPFPPGSEERERLLRSFNAFRKQIDQLTIPPREEFMKMVMADPGVVPESRDWGVVKDNGQSGTIHGQQVHTGSRGLNIPEIPEGATDDEVVAFLKDLDVFSEIVRQRRSDLAEDAMSIGKLLGDGRVRDTRETDIELKSLELRDTMRTESIASLTNAQVRLMELL